MNLEGSSSSTMRATGIVARRGRLCPFSPGVRAGEAATELGISEAELIATMSGADVVRLDANPPDLLYALTEVGHCIAFTRNPHAVCRARGRYGGIELGLHAARVAGDGIDLHVNFEHWCNVFAIDEPDPQRPGGRCRSIHAFDRSGAAVHEIQLEPEDDPRTWDAIVATRAVSTPLVIQPPSPRRSERSDAAVDRKVLLAEWDAMQEPGERSQLQARHRLTPIQTLRVAGDARAWQVTGGAIEHVLEAATGSGDPIQIAIGNHGCVQSLAGTIDQIAHRGPWLDVLATRFDARLRTDRIASSWVVGYPTRAGMVRSLDLFDAAGETLAVVSRASSAPGAQDRSWRALLEALPRLR